MALAVPDRSLDQRFAALDKANEVRFGRASIKNDLHALSYNQARRRVADLIEESPAVLDTMKVETLLMAIPRFGRTKVGKLMWSHGISPRKLVGGLSPRQREELADVLRLRDMSEDYRRRVSTEMRLRQAQTGA